MESIRAILRRAGGTQENVIMLLRRHWFVIVYRLASVALLMLLIVVAFGIFSFIFRGTNLTGLMNFVESLALMFAWIVLFNVWIDYYFDVWIITDQRVINIEQKGLFSRHVSELKFSKIQDVTTEIHGIIPTLLDFGDVYVQTAGEQVRFVFRQVPRPNRAKELLIRLQEQQRREETDEFGEMVKEKIENSA